MQPTSYQTSPTAGFQQSSPRNQNRLLHDSQSRHNGQRQHSSKPYPETMGIGNSAPGVETNSVIHSAKSLHTVQHIRC